jgi:putative FmdB family regulatory protein
MAEYQYRCNSCRRLFATQTRADATTCPDCAGPATRKFGFYVASSLKEHWNQAVGQYVSNSHDMSEALKRKSEEMSVRTGIDHDYQYVSPAEMADPSAHGASQENLDETYRRQAEA